MLKRCGGVLVSVLAAAGVVAPAWGQPVRVTVEYDVEATSDTVRLFRTAPIMKEGGSGGTRTETVTVERLLDGAASHLERVGLLTEGWQESGRRTVDGEVVIVFTKSVPREVPAAEPQRVGDARARVMLRLRPAVEGDDLVLDPTFANLETQTRGMTGESTAFRRLKAGLFKADVEREMRDVVSRLSRRIPLSESEAATLFDESSGALEKVITFSWFGETKTAVVRITSERRRVVRGRVGP